MFKCLILYQNPMSIWRTCRTPPFRPYDKVFNACIPLLVASRFDAEDTGLKREPFSIEAAYLRCFITGKKLAQIAICLLMIPKDGISGVGNREGNERDYSNRTWDNLKKIRGKVSHEVGCGWSQSEGTQGKSGVNMIEIHWIHIWNDEEFVKM